MTKATRLVTMPCMKAVAQRAAYLIFSHALASVFACVVLLAMLLPVFGIFFIPGNFVGDPLQPAYRVWLAFPLALLTTFCARIAHWSQDLYLLGSVAMAWLIYLTSVVITYRTLHEIDGRERREQQQRLLAGGRCPTCEYNLTGNTSGTCPECGTVIGSGNSGGVPS